jgi:hypothetical protein
VLVLVLVLVLSCSCNSACDKWACVMCGQHCVRNIASEAGKESHCGHGLRAVLYGDEDKGSCKVSDGLHHHRGCGREGSVARCNAVVARAATHDAVVARAATHVHGAVTRTALACTAWCERPSHCARRRWTAVTRRSSALR